MAEILREVPNHFSLPRRISRLGELAYNLWWAWNPDAARFFSDRSHFAGEGLSQPGGVPALIDRAHLNAPRMTATTWKLTTAIRF
jgi:starch phosphorylase